MSAVLVAYEDTYFSELDRTVRRVMRQHAPSTAQRERCPVKGVTNFGNFVKREWPLYRDKGFPVAGKPRMERLVCVADADAIAAQLPGIPPCPSTGPTSSWLATAERAFEEFLHAHADKDAHHISGVLLRWNYESLVIAGFDVPQVLAALSGLDAVDQSAVDNHLKKCRPHPADTPNETFVDAFRDSQGCLDALARAAGWRRLKKGDPRKDTALDLLSGHALELLVGRVPDLMRVAQVISEQTAG